MSDVDDFTADRRDDTKQPCTENSVQNETNNRADYN